MESIKPASSLARMFDILDLLSIERPVLRAENITRTLGYTRATTYRYLKALCDAGLLALGGGGIYTLGPRILELERLQVLTDPLLRASQAVTAELAKAAPRNSFMVSSLYRDKVLCIHQDGATRFTVEGRIIPLIRAKGLQLPLFSGAASRAILAWLPLNRIKALYLDKPDDIAVAGLGNNWREFRAQTAAMRKKGYAETVGQVNPDLAAIAAPIRTADGQVLGSLGQLMLRKEFDKVGETAPKQITAAAAKIEAHISAEFSAEKTAIDTANAASFCAGRFQSICAAPRDQRKSLVFEKGRNPKNPR